MINSIRLPAGFELRLALIGLVAFLERHSSLHLPVIKHPLVHSRTKGHAFRGTTSLYRLVSKPVRSPPGPSSRLRCNGLTRAGLLSACADFFCNHTRRLRLRRLLGVFQPYEPLFCRKTAGLLLLASRYSVSHIIASGQASVNRNSQPGKNSTPGAFANEVGAGAGLQLPILPPPAKCNCRSNQKWGRDCFPLARW